MKTLYGIRLNPISKRLSVSNLEIEEFFEDSGLIISVEWFYGFRHHKEDLDRILKDYEADSIYIMTLDEEKIKDYCIRILTTLIEKNNREIEDLEKSNLAFKEELLSIEGIL